MYVDDDDEHCIHAYTAERRDVLENTSNVGILHPEIATEIWNRIYFSKCLKSLITLHRSVVQCTGILLELEVKYWFCGVTTDGAGVSQCFSKSWPTIFIRFCLSYICFFLVSTTTVLTFCLSVKAYIVPFYARMCSWYSPQGEYRGILKIWIIIPSMLYKKCDEHWQC